MTRFYSSTAQPTTLSAACTNSATSIQVTATTGFPAVEFILALDYGGAAQELVKVTNVAGTTLTVVRGFDSTTAQAHSLGAAVQHVHSADDFRLSRTHEAASSGVHGAAGAVVGTSDAQALSNKDLSSGTNTFPTSLATTGGAQTLTNKTVALGSNTVSGTTAQFNTALTDNDFATLAGAETLTNKTLTNPTVTNGTFSSPSITGVGERRFVRKTVDETLSSNTTFQNDDVLLFTVASGATYVLDLRLFVDGGGSIKFGLNGPASMTYDVDIQSYGTANAFSQGVGFNNTSTILGIPSASAATLVTARMHISAGTGGTVWLQWAQFSSSATTTGVLGGSRAYIERLA